MSGWNLRNHNLLQLKSSSRSFCIISMFDSSEIVRNIFVSSASINASQTTLFGRSLMKTTKRMGPKTDPCGTLKSEMPVPSQGHYGFHSFPVVDWFCLFIDTYGFWLSLCKIIRNSIILLLPLFTYIPLVTLCHVDFDPLTCTHWCLLLRKLSIQLHVLSLIP